MGDDGLRIGVAGKVFRHPVGRAFIDDDVFEVINDDDNEYFGRHETITRVL